MDTRETALFWLSQGVASVPLKYRSKVPAVKWTPYRTQLPSESIINLWYQEPRNIALVTGWCGLTVLDFDSVENYAWWYIWNFERNPKILDTFRCTTNRGIHIYYYLREPIKLASIQCALFEVKTAGRLVTAPPSVHESGRVYTALDNLRNIRVVRPEEILNYSPIHLISKPASVIVSRYAPTVDSERTSCIGKIKSRVKILSFFPHAEKVDTEGRYWITGCPFHKHQRNFWIDNTINRCGCWAGCGNFDVISLWARLHNLSNGEAIKELLRMI